MPTSLCASKSLGLFDTFVSERDLIKGSVSVNIVSRVIACNYSFRVLCNAMFTKSAVPLFSITSRTNFMVSSSVYVFVKKYRTYKNFGEFSVPILVYSYALSQNEVNTTD